MRRRMIDDDDNDGVLKAFVKHISLSSSVYLRHRDCLSQTSVQLGVQTCNIILEAEFMLYIQHYHSGIYGSVDLYYRDLCR